MKTLWMFALVGIAGAWVGCGDDDDARTDSGIDAAVGPIPCEENEDCDTYCNFGTFTCCVPADPPYEICGDMIDQNCSGYDASCGDQDRDGVQACRPGEDPTSGTCDCDDERADVRPAAPEVCDGIDNNCNGRIDESAECCEGCASLGASWNRADVCTLAGECDCSTAEGVGPCPEGQQCCAVGCVDVRSDVLNCGFCGAPCTASSDRCVAGECRCGDGDSCELNFECEAGVCVE
ncbi:MAG: hypothetical protein KF901_05070 [Myxococcales bacterium]|nr:hypothetical protein [Myxococcales bacterium]